MNIISKPRTENTEFKQIDLILSSLYRNKNNPKNLGIISKDLVNLIKKYSSFTVSFDIYDHKTTTITTHKKYQIINLKLNVFNNTLNDKNIRSVVIASKEIQNGNNVKIKKIYYRVDNEEHMSDTKQFINIGIGVTNNPNISIYRTRTHPLTFKCTFCLSIDSTYILKQEYHNGGYTNIKRLNIDINRFKTNDIIQIKKHNNKIIWYLNDELCYSLNTDNINLGLYFIISVNMVIFHGRNYSNLNILQIK